MYKNVCRNIICNRKKELQKRPSTKVFLRFYYKFFYRKVYASTF